MRGQVWAVSWSDILKKDILEVVGIVKMVEMSVFGHGVVCLLVVVTLVAYFGPVFVVREVEVRGVVVAALRAGAFAPRVPAVRVMTWQVGRRPIVYWCALVG